MDRGAAVSRFDDYTPEVIRETEGNYIHDSLP